MNRQDFLARLTKARVPREERPSGPVVTAPADPVSSLLTACREAGVGARQVKGAPEALGMALALIKDSGAQGLGYSDLGPELMPLLPQSAAEAGLEIVFAADDVTDAVGLVESLPAGLTCCELAVAETGTLVQAARPGGGRLLSLLPALHVALIRPKDILPTLADLPQALADVARFPLGPTPAVSLISGPSRTGDIEAVIVTGVHGPGRLEVVVWE